MPNKGAKIFMNLFQKFPAFDRPYKVRGESPPRFKPDLPSPPPPPASHGGGVGGGWRLEKKPGESNGKWVRVGNGFGAPLSPEPPAQLLDPPIHRPSPWVGNPVTPSHTATPPVSLSAFVLITHTQLTLTPHLSLAKAVLS